MQHYRTARAQATLDVFRRASPAHGTRGRTVALANSILAGHDISLASISSKAAVFLPTSTVPTVGRLVGPVPQHARAAYDAMDIGAWHGAAARDEFGPPGPL